KPMKVSNFSLIEKTVKSVTTTIPSSQQAAASPEPVHRKILILVDNNYLEKVERDRALRTIENYLQSDEFHGEWAVAAIAHMIVPVQPFTSDKSLIHAAIDKVRHMPVSASYHEIDRSILSDQSRKNLDIGEDYDYGQTIRFSSREQTYRNLMTLKYTARAV